MLVLGISCFFHDASAALLQDGRLVAAASEESFSRVKHDPHYPERAIAYCLEAAGARPEDLDYAVFYEKPFLKFERLMTTLVSEAPRSWRVFPKAMRSWLGEKLWIRNRLLERLGLPPERLLFSGHHASHAASAFFCSPFARAAALTIDGVGEWSTASWGRGEGSRLELKEEIRFPHSLGLLYSAFTSFLGFEVNEGEYKVMGMAAYGEPRHEDKVRRLLRLFADGSFELDLDYFSFTHDDRCMVSRKFLDLWGPPRDPRAPADPERERGYADIAASLQKVLEEAVLGLARRAHERTGEESLCLAGGVAFNCMANRRILAETPFKRVFVQPAAGDAGGALGAALYAWHVLLGKPRAFVMEHAYWGPEHGAEAARRAVAEAGLKAEELSAEALRERAVDALMKGRVIGWHQGRLEWGPRALGHRSILANPTLPDTKDRVNVKVKFREPYRPFAPALLSSDAARYFKLQEGGTELYRYMLATAEVIPGKRAELPAVTHADGTARLQCLEPAVEPGFSSLIRDFGSASGTPVLLNTSFNLKGEPIVDTPAQAVADYLNSGLDACALGNLWLAKG